MAFPRIINGSESESYEVDTTEARAKIGQKMVIEDGRAYRYCKAGGVALIAALLNSGAIPEVAKYGDQACAAEAVGQTVIDDVGATTTNMAANELINGYCWSEQTTQLGPAARIEDNTLITQGAETGTITLHSPLSVAIGATDTLSYIRNTWRNVLVAATTQAAQTCGVTVSAIPISNFGWLQVSGPAKIQTSGSILIDDYVVGSTSAGGEVMPSAALETDGPAVGVFMSWEQSNEDGLFFLIIE